MRKKTIEETYQELSELDHIIKRPNIWVGSIKEELKMMYIYDSSEGKISMDEITYSPAMLKIFDEVLSNSCDEFRRETNLGLNEIKVTVNKDDNSITVYDNGGIPVVKHKEAKCYVPEFIFGRLRTSSNYDDTETRIGVGTNGVGSALCNVFSTKFIIDTCDGKNSYHRSWEDNMRKLCDDLKVVKSKQHFTQTKFYIDFSKFDISDKYITDDFIKLIEKRCIDASAGNFGLKISFELIKDNKQIYSSKWKFKNFEDYIELYSDFIDSENSIIYKDKYKQIWIYPESNINIGFVNGSECSKGTHIDGIRSFINNFMREELNKKSKIDIRPSAIDSKYSMFCILNIVNPTYDSQTKDTLDTPLAKFYKDENIKFDIPDKFLTQISKSDLYDIMVDWYKQKSEVEDAAKLRKINRDAKKLFKCDKYIKCNSKKISEKQLWLFEGDSAKGGFRVSRDPELQAAYLMRGVGLNTEGMSPIRIMKNAEFSDMFNILGLQWGKDFDINKLNFGKIVICSDMDPDGSKIAAILMVFFNHFPQLFENKKIVRALSPLIIATKGKDKLTFYTMEEYHKNEKKLRGYKIRYIKGLAGLQNEDYKIMMREPHFDIFTKDKMSDILLQKWFGKGIATERKKMLKSEVEADC